MLKAVLVFAAFFGLALGLFGPDANWEMVGPAPREKVISFYVALPQQNVDELESLYWKVTDPKSPKYGKFLTMQEIQDMVAPSKEIQKRVVDYFAAHNVDTKVYGDFAECHGSVEAIEKAFPTLSLSVFRHKTKGHSVIRHVTGSFSIPRELLEIGVQMVTGLTEFAPDRYADVEKKELVGDETTSYYVVPQTLRTIYNVPESLSATHPNSSQCVVEFGSSAGISDEDLKAFQTYTATPSQLLNYTVGPYIFVPTNPIDGEATLDVQYIIAMGKGTNTSFWVVDGWMYDLTSLIQSRQLNGQAVPWIFSMSYGWAESQTCSITGNGVPCSQLGGSYESYVSRTNSEFMKIGLTGVSLIGISQDAGAASKWNKNCKQNPPVNPSWPGASPFILTVGATMLDPATILSSTYSPPLCADVQCAGGGQEIVCSVQTGALITSGGGFSTVAPRPDYQEKAVQQWLQSGGLTPPAKYYNASNRGEPDLSTLGHQYFIVENGKNLTVDGTSASAPVFAGLVALLNDWRFNNNQPPLGPLNTLFYQMWETNPGTFQDIVIGNNTGTEASLLHPHGVTCLGYGATKGWDPVTGLGSPNFQNVLNYISDLF